MPVGDQAARNDRRRPRQVDAGNQSNPIQPNPRPVQAGPVEGGTGLWEVTRDVPDPPLGSASSARIQKCFIRTPCPCPYTNLKNTEKVVYGHGHGHAYDPESGFLDAN